MVSGTKGGPGLVSQDEFPLFEGLQLLPEGVMTALPPLGFFSNSLLTSPRTQWCTSEENRAFVCMGGNVKLKMVFVGEAFGAD